jgi:cytochrome c5
MKSGFGRAGNWIAMTIVTSMMAFGAGQGASQLEKGQQVLNQACNACHDLRPIQTQAMDKDGWTRVVNAMIEKGAQVKADDMPALLEYLVRYYGPLPEGPGKNIVLNVCTICHDLERVKAHAGTRDQWEETLIAMLNEGAPLSDQDFPVVLAYLARYFRPR